MRLHPDFTQMLYQEFGEQKAQQILAAYKNKEPVRGLKMNVYKKIEYPFQVSSSFLNEAIVIPEDYKLAVVHPFHHAGCYYIQDPSATLSVKALDPKETDIVLDMCAAPGGKTTQILNAIPQGFLISNEQDYTRSIKLIGNVERWGVEQCVVVNHDGQDLPTYFENTFDKIVLDAPCSGEGLYRKHPEHAQNFKMKTVYDLAALQIQLLFAAYQCSVDGGEILYSTCTMNPFENEEVVLAFLKMYPECELIDHGLSHAEPGIRGLGNRVARFYPSEFGEGHFIAKIKVHKDCSRAALEFSPYKEQTRVIHKIEFKGNIKEAHEKVRILRNRGFLKTNAHVILDGTIIAAEKKGRYEFTQACAYSVNHASDIPKRELDEDQAFQYLYGLTIPNIESGYQIVTFAGVPLGFVKGQNNKYPKNLRNRFEKYK